MFRFTIRELLLLTLVIGLAAGWVVDHRRLQPCCDRAQGPQRLAATERSFAPLRIGRMTNDVSTPISCADLVRSEESVNEAARELSRVQRWTTQPG